MIKLTSVAEIELSYRPIKCEPIQIKSANDAFIEFNKFFPEATIALQEMAVVMYLKKSHKILGFYRLSTGGITGTMVDIRLLFATALKVAATNFMLCHNHPSGSLKPSTSDIELTSKLKEAGKWLDIKLLDHLIISPDGNYFSFTEDGLI